MCGIAGFVDRTGKWGELQLNKMSAALASRGPDAEATRCAPTWGLAHRRLSIIDPGERSNQPFTKANSNFLLVFNGEIYNYAELRRQYSLPCETDSDTEVLFLMLERFGLNCLNELNGMFAFAWMDLRDNTLKLVRDRFGIKPLVYFFDGANRFAFASELKALLALPVARKLRRQALADYLFLEYIPGPEAVYEHFYRLEPGHCATFDASGLRVVQWYALPLTTAEKRPVETEAVEHLGSLLEDSVKLRLRSDVPVGAFLSGGADSSAIAAAAVRNQPTIEACHLAFDAPVFDETSYARQTAKTLNLTLLEKTAAQDEALAHAERLPDVYSEPYASPSVFPSLLVCAFAAREWKVALAGDGGDELFMGYGYYNWHDRISQFNFPGGRFAAIAASQILNFGGARWQRAARYFNLPKEKAHWYPHVWSQAQEMFSRKEIRALLTEPPADEEGFFEAKWRETDALHVSTWKKISLFDFQTYLPYNLLHKMDVASMSHSLEVRLPMLDNRFVEYALQLETNLHFQKGRQKYLLKQLLRRSLPDELIFRKKWGFPAPMASWLRGALSPLIARYLSPQALKQSGVFRPEIVAQYLAEFKRGRGGHEKRLWAIINFEMWKERYGG